MSADATPRFEDLSLQFQRYQWEPIPGVSSAWHRATLSTENSWLHQEEKYRQMFLGGSLTVEVPVTLEAFSMAASDAWKGLRNLHPEVAMIARLEGGKGLLQYFPPRDEDAVNTWVQRTLYLEQGAELESAAMRKSIQDWKRSSIEIPACVLLRCVAPSTVQFVLHADHQITDGVGIRLLLNSYFGLLADALVRKTGEPIEKDIKWNDSRISLTPPWIGSCMLS